MSIVLYLQEIKNYINGIILTIKLLKLLFNYVINCLIYFIVFKLGTIKCYSLFTDLL